MNLNYTLQGVPTETTPDTTLNHNVNIDTEQLNATTNFELDTKDGIESFNVLLLAETHQNSLIGTSVDFNEKVTQINAKVLENGEMNCEINYNSEKSVSIIKLPFSDVITIVVNGVEFEVTESGIESKQAVSIGAPRPRP